MPEIRVTGLKELDGALKQIDRGLSRELSKGLRDIAKGIAGKVSQLVPHDDGDAARSISGRASGTTARIVAGGDKAPHYPWLDFGGTTGRGHKRGRGRGAIVRDMPNGGRYIYPTIADNGPLIAREVDDVMKHLIKKAGFDTSGEVA